MSGISISTFLLIAHGGDDVRASHYTTLDGTAIPMVERRHGEAWWPLVTWDDLQMSPADAEEHARRFIESIRQENRQPRWCDSMGTIGHTCHEELDGLSISPIPLWHRWILAPIIKPAIPWPQGGWECTAFAPVCVGSMAPISTVRMVP